MPQVANPRKSFQFKVDIAGVNQGEIQKVTLPEMEIEETTHGEANYDSKTPGRVKFSDMVFEKLRVGDNTDRWAVNWFMEAQNVQLGGGKLPSNVKRDIVIREMAADNITTLNRWYCEGCWVKKIKISDFDRESSDNTMETVTLAVDRMYPV